MIISVINLKGGSGKTTTAMALATAAARHNRNVSVLDTDPQGDATTWAGDAEDAGETLPFTVDSANIGKLKRLRKTMADDELVIIDCPPAGNAVNLIRERGASVFDASVPKRVGMQKVVGHAFPSNLNGYEDVYLELEEAIA